MSATTHASVDLPPETTQRLAVLGAVGAAHYRLADLRWRLGTITDARVAEALAELERAVEAVVEAVRAR